MANLPAIKSLEFQLDQIQNNLDKCTDVVDAWNTKKKLQVFKEASLIYQRKDLAIKCSKLMCKAEYRIAHNHDPGGNNKKAEVIEGIHPDNLRKIREAYKQFSPEEFRTKIQHLEDEGIVPTRQAFLGTTPRSFSGRFEYYTPKPILDAARRCVGEFDLDPASCEEANQNVQAKKYFTIKDDGLRSDWGHKPRVWLNPPFTKLKEFAHMFLYKAHKGFFLGRNDPTCSWCYTMYKCSTCVFYCKDRNMMFTIPGGKKVRPIETPCVFCFNIDPQLAIKEFLHVGKINGHFAKAMSDWDILPPKA